MPLLRSGSAKSTLSMMQRRTTKYQKFLNLSNVFLLITSTILIFSAVILIKFYHIDKLDFWSLYFWLVPILMIVLGVFTFLVCVYGFLISGSENRLLLIIYASLLAIAFIAQLVSIFSALELRTTIAQGSVSTGAVNTVLDSYGENSRVTSNWDTMQRELHCCGGNNFNTGYTDWRNTKIGRNGSVPDTCCHYDSPGCGAGILNKTPTEARNLIFVDGCLTILKTRLQDDVIGMMISYAVIGVILAVIELITVVLACSYVAQITRKRRREDKMWRHGTADHQGGGDDATDALNHETVC